MNWQDLRKVDPDPGKVLQIFCSGNCYFAKAFKRQDGSMIFVVSQTYKALFDIKNELLPCYTNSFKNGMPTGHYLLSREKNNVRKTFR